MVTAKIKELEATRARVAALEKSVAAELRKELKALPRKYGFSSMDAFFAALRSTAGRSVAGGKRRRAVITNEMRSRVKTMVGAGKTGAQIADELKISLPSVHNIKKSLGLVKGRKK